MSRRRSIDMTGIEPRHQRHCSTRADGACNCSPAYRATFWHSSLKAPLRATLPTPESAARWRQDRQRELELGTLTQPSTLLVSEALDDAFSRARRRVLLNKWGRPYKPSAIRSYQDAANAHLIPIIGHQRVSNLTDELIQEEVIERLLGLGRAPSTIRNALVPLRVVCRLAIRRQILGHDPFASVDLPALTRVRWEGIESDEVNALVAAAEDRDRALVATALYGGLRRGELQALPVRHIDLRRNVIRVRMSWDRKAGIIAPKSESSIRDVPIIKRLRPLLETRLAENPFKRDDLFFGRLPDRPFDPGTVSDRLRASWRAHDLPVLTFHECRHAFASSAIAAKANMKTLQRVMGHSSMAITYDVYGHLLPNSLDELGTELDTHFG